MTNFCNQAQGILRQNSSEVSCIYAVDLAIGAQSFADAQQSCSDMIGLGANFVDSLQGPADMAVPIVRVSYQNYSAFYAKILKRLLVPTVNNVILMLYKMLQTSGGVFNAMYMSGGTCYIYYSTLGVSYPTPCKTMATSAFCNEGNEPVKYFPNN